MGRKSSWSGHELREWFRSNLIPVLRGEEIEATTKLTDPAGVEHTGAIAGEFQGASAELTASQTLADNSWNTLEFDGVAFDHRNEYDAINYKFVADSDGRYLVNIGVRFQAFAADGRASLRVLKGGSVTDRHDIAAKSAHPTSNAFSKVYELTAGEEVQIQAATYSGSNEAATGDSYLTVTEVQ